MNTILVAAFSVVVYAIIQVLDAKMVQKEKPDPKAIARRCAMMFSSVLAGMALYDQFSPLMAQIGDKMDGGASAGGAGGAAKVFTDAPGF
jgi:hypothetical protein